MYIKFLRNFLEETFSSGPTVTSLILNFAKNNSIRQWNEIHAKYSSVVINGVSSTFKLYQFAGARNSAGYYFIASVP